MNCKNCSSNDTFWFIHLQNAGTAQNRLLALNEIVAKGVLGCRNCGETLKIIGQDEIEVMMNKSKGM